MSSLRPLTTRVRGWLSNCLRPLAARAAKAYVAGDRLEDALAVADRLEDRGLGATLGYWDGLDEAPRAVADQYLAAADVLAGRKHAYLSIKLPSLKFSTELLGEVVEHAARGKVRIHFDALAPETAERTRRMVDKLVEGGVEVSYTLPGRWQRSLDDAHWAAERKLVVRVVKGQWPDPIDPKRDLREGFLQVVDALAGRARHVALASHDVPLVAEAVARLRRADTSCEQELLYGLPTRDSLALADQLSLGVHVYVPYGQAYLPYALSRMRSDPRVAWWLLRDLLASRHTGTEHTAYEPCELTSALSRGRPMAVAASGHRAHTRRQRVQLCPQREVDNTLRKLDLRAKRSIWTPKNHQQSPSWHTLCCEI